ncbi:S8 family serine peptidase [Actinoplanes sp. NPDC089786]|uniref:S8 family serine peptidase n=1 Tax=Actinoplanes sp. NPDC089786 TaxID=3155185 RepID=UPI0034142EAD
MRARPLGTAATGGLAVALALGAGVATGPVGVANAAAATGAAAAPVRLMSGEGWLNQVGSTLLAPVIRGAGGDKADKADPDVGSGPAGVKLTGAGVGVALIDSGVSPVPGLNAPGKVIKGPDLSFESQAPNLRHLDTYGHGTHMAGIIAGSDPASAPGATRFAGVAPGAHLVSLKVASADGASDVSQVIAAIDWVVAHRDDKGMNIRVLNLSFGTGSTQSTALDPLAFAVENAWSKGIVVVVSAGNDGFAANSLTMPAADPDVIAVGAADARGTEARADDVVADFSNRGNAGRHADVLASGRSVVSLRVPGSYVDRTYPAARLSTTADPAQRFIRGSGTSQAAAVVSGAVALLLQQRPNLSPDQVKRLLMATAKPITGADAYAGGNGQIDVAAAAVTKKPSSAPQVNVAATGLGSLERSRGGVHVYDPANDVELSGERDIFGRAWVAPTWALASKTQNSWRDGSFNGTRWTGGAFGTDVSGQRTWSSVAWTGRSWAGSTWAGRSWADAQWNGRSWAGRSWAGRSWAGRSWASADWSGAPWQ